MALIAETLQKILSEKDIFPEGVAICEVASGEVKLQFDVCTIHLDRDRNGIIVSTVDAGGTDSFSVEHWARYLGDEDIELSFDKHGWVVTSVETQLNFLLLQVRHIVDEILSDPQQRELALQFIRGYHTGYNDWASGKWDIE